MTGEQYLTVTELSEYIKRSKPAIRMLVLRRAIPYKKPSGRLLFNKTEIDRWIEMAEGIGIDEIMDREKRMNKK